MKYVLSVVGLELYALLLAWQQSLGGVRTDEAKMLLSIPYPHPPLLRWIVSQTEFLPFQEMLWRVLFASLLVQAVWLVWDMGKGLRPAVRLLAAATWLLSAAFLQQVGSITTAPVTAVFGLVFCWFSLCSWKNPSPSHSAPSSWPRGGRGQGEGLPLPSVLAFLWLLSLFTAYQVVLYLPIVVAVLRRLQVTWKWVACSVGVPLFLVGLYALGNPLSLDRFVDAGTLNMGKTVFQKFSEVGSAAMVGGGAVSAVVGLYGVILTRARALSLSLLFVAAFVFLSSRPYYAILFTPLFTSGVILLLRERPQWWKNIGIAYLFALLLLRPFPLGMMPGPAREVMQRLEQEGARGEVLISGSFGHEWQYESRLPIRRYRPEFLDEAGAIVCLGSCDDFGDSWRKLDGGPVDVWVR